MTKRCVSGLQQVRKTTLICLVVLVLLLLSWSVTAEQEFAGEIKVFVKDQSGDNVNCFGGNCVSRLREDMIIELYKDNIKVDDKLFPAGDISDNITFDVNQTGPYLIRTLAVLRFVDPGYACVITPDSSLLVPRCEDVCPRLYADLQTDPLDPLRKNASNFSESLEGIEPSSGKKFVQEAKSLDTSYWHGQSEEVVDGWLDDKVVQKMNKIKEALNPSICVKNCEGLSSVTKVKYSIPESSWNDPYTWGGQTFKQKFEEKIANAKAVWGIDIEIVPVPILG